MIVEAWAPTRELCLREAVLGLVEVFADPDAARAVVPASRRARVPIELDAPDDEELLVALLEDVVYALDALDSVPVDARLDLRPDGGVTGWLETVPSAILEDVGAVPKGVSRSDMTFREEAGMWRCRAEIDV